MKATLPVRVFSAIDDAGKRFTLDACYDLVHGVATAWALEARSKGSKDWENISVVLHSSYPEAMSAIQESGATVFVPCVGKDDAVSTSSSGALETPKRTPKAEGGGASAGKVAAALAPPAAAVASQSTVAISSPSKSPSKQLAQPGQS